MEALIDLAGWVGSLLLISAYWSVSKKRMEPESFLYQSLNVIGSVLLIVNTYYYGAFPSTAVNIIWVCMGLFYIAKLKRK